MPLLFICAFVANAASFVLPISNPANLVVFGVALPALGAWLSRLAIPSFLAIAVTYAALLWTQRRSLGEICAQRLQLPPLRRNGWAAAAGIAATAVALPIASAFGMNLGTPTAICGVVTAVCVVALDRRALLPILRSVQWSILALVAALFVLVELLLRSGALRAETAWIENGISVALLSNLITNLPVALLARNLLAASHATARTIDGVLIGVDLGPNLCVTGSLATLLWLGVLRREKERVSWLLFLRTGIVVMPPALLAAIGARWLL